MFCYNLLEVVIWNKLIKKKINLFIVSLMYMLMFVCALYMYMHWICTVRSEFHMVQILQNDNCLHVCAFIILVNSDWLNVIIWTV